MMLDFVCGDEVYGTALNCAIFEDPRPGIRAAGRAELRLALAAANLTCAGAGAQVKGAPQGGALGRERLQGDRWYGWAWMATAFPWHCLLIRRHLKTGELAFHYCYVPGAQPLTLTRLIRAAGLRWPVEEDFRLGKDCFGLDESQVRLYTAIARAHRPGHGRPGHLRHHRRAPAQRPDRHPGTSPGPPWPAATCLTPA